ncbi:hypothetical protein ACWDTT_16010 [Streptosporangium sandarakinum]
MTETNEPELRLIVCRTCKTVDELPDFHGPVIDDVLLDIVASRHEYGPNAPHEGLMPFRVPEKHWKNSAHKAEILERIKERVGMGLGDDFYNVKNQFQEDAQTCWKARNRTKNCDDWRSEKKRLVPDTAAERKAAGLGKPTSNRFLCDFCPVQSVKMQRMRAARGDYHYTL